MVSRNVLRDPQIPIGVKGLYAYLAGFAGDSDECFPSINTIQSELSLAKDTLYKYMNLLVSIGVVERNQTYNGNLKGKVIYRITDNEYILNNRIPKNTETENQCSMVSENLGIQKARIPECKETNINSLNINSLNNNNNKDREYINYQQIADLYNDTCVSFPRLTKLSDSRKKAIKARMKTYSLEDFKKLFQMAEESSFLKGENARNWSATFDWLIKDSNMAKVLDGNYQDKQQVETAPDTEHNSYYDIMEEYANLPKSPDDPWQ